MAKPRSAENTSTSTSDQTPLSVKVKKLAPSAVLPVKAHPDDAAYDLTATAMEVKFFNQQGQEVQQNQASHALLIMKTGIALEIPTGWQGRIFPRSNITKTAFHLANSVGIIDAGYRNEIEVRLRFHDPYAPIPYKIGDRVAQICIEPVYQVDFVESTDLTSSARGQGGFGSTGGALHVQGADNGQA